MANLRDLLDEYPTDTELRANLRQWQDDVFAAIEAAGKSDHPSVKFGGSVPLHLLDAQSQVDFMARYRKLIGLNSVLNKMSQQGPNKFHDFLASKYGIKGDLNNQIMNVWSNLTGERSLSTGAAFGRFQGTEENTLIGRIYGSMNLQMYDRPTRGVKTGISAPGASVRSYFGIGSIPLLENLDKPTTVDLRNKNIMVFDIETAGFRPGSIREVAFKAFQTTDSGTFDYGRLSKGGQAPIVLRPMQGTRGQVMGKTSAVNLDEFLQEKFNLRADLGSTGDDFIEKMMPFLQKASEADMVVGHNVERFDFAQIFEGLAGTKRYRDDVDGFKQQVDELYDTINSKTVDTLRLARQAPNLAGLGSSRLTAGQSAYSLENLLLKTDLGKRIGIENIATAMGRVVGADGTVSYTKGLHHADVDVLLTTGFLQHRDQLRKTSMLGSGLTGNARLFAREIIKEVQKSAAITPFTDIRDREQIAPHLRHFFDTGEGINPIEQEILLQRQLQLGHTVGAVQESVDPRRFAESLGGFDRLIGRRRGMEYSDVYDELIKPSATEFASYQQRLASLGYGFAGLSYEERLFGTALSDITLRGRNPIDRMARETLVSKFELFDPKAIQYVTKSGKITLPAQVLEAAGLLDKAGDPAYYNLSTVQPTVYKPTASVNLAYNFASSEDIDEVVKVLGRMRENEESFSRILGVSESREAFTKFAKAYDEGKLVEGLKSANTGKYGVTVGQITDNDAVNRIIALEAAANNSNNLRDATRLKFRLAHADLDIEGGRIVTAGAFLDKGLETTDRTFIERSVAQARRIFDPSSEVGFGAIRRNPRLAASAAFYDREQIVSDTMPKIFDFMQDRVIPNMPKIALGTVALGVGGFLYARKRRNDRYDIDLVAEGQDPGQGRYAVADILQARIDAGYDGARVQVDPLATASLTQHLYYCSIGHTNMDWDRNTAIYGGLL
jgi:hypothetical protein